MQSNTYKVYVYCTNCGANEYVEVPKGTRLDNFACPNCGCKTLTISHNDLFWDTDFVNPFNKRCIRHDPARDDIEEIIHPKFTC